MTKNIKIDFVIGNQSTHSWDRSSKDNNYDLEEKNRMIIVQL